MEVLKLLSLKGVATLHIIPIVLRLGLIKLNIDVLEVFNYSLPPLILLVYKHIPN